MQKEILQDFKNQLSFGYDEDELIIKSTYPDTIVNLLSDDLNFHNHRSNYASHNFHSFPAKFPPQLPLKFIKALTKRDDVVLDPMMGSGTTVVESILTGRKAIGFDIDPLAVKIAKVKTTPIDAIELIKQCKSIVLNARTQVKGDSNNIKKELAKRWDSSTKQFIDYWFSDEIQIELLALLLQITNISSPEIKSFFELAFSATIITKSGGVSFALDLAHTRPHKAKVVLNKDGRFLFGEDIDPNTTPRLKFLRKKLRSAIDDFEKRCCQNIEGLANSAIGRIKPVIKYGNAQRLPLEDETVDLIVTSPPYASNAIDYMRAHKFSLIWLGYPIDDLSLKRKHYIGGEDTINVEFEKLPYLTSGIVADMTMLDKKRGKVLHRYYSEMKRTLHEMYRVLKSNKAAIVVVGNSVMRGKDTQTQKCLAEIGESIGFEVPKIGLRKLDRNKRMMPAGFITDTNSQIQQRMHEEYVIGFYKV